MEIICFLSICITSSLFNLNSLSHLIYFHIFLFGFLFLFNFDLTMPMTMTITMSINTTICTCMNMYLTSDKLIFNFYQIINSLYFSSLHPEKRILFSLFSIESTILFLILLDFYAFLNIIFYIIVLFLITNVSYLCLSCTPWIICIKLIDKDLVLLLWRCYACFSDRWSTQG